MKIKLLLASWAICLILVSCAGRDCSKGSGLTKSGRGLAHPVGVRKDTNDKSKR